MQIGDISPNSKYKMWDQEVDYVKQIKGFGVIINGNYKMSDQCTVASNKANTM